MAGCSLAWRWVLDFLQVQLHQRPVMDMLPGLVLVAPVQPESSEQLWPPRARRGGGARLGGARGRRDRRAASSVVVAGPVGADGVVGALGAVLDGELGGGNGADIRAAGGVGGECEAMDGSDTDAAESGSGAEGGEECASDFDE